MANLGSVPNVDKGITMSVVNNSPISNRTEIDELDKVLFQFEHQRKLGTFRAKVAKEKIEALLQNKMTKEQVKQLLNLAFDMYARGQQPNDQQFDNLWEDFKKGER